ncbi:SGNH/GDSL hydrolase family protein [Leptospira santarosai]|uniref:SGNH/GDSL hydrolase family protein n=1 Tax=Leptospira santarosai TaxID=28183 RepID=UPI0024AFF47F|nr:SGNH/GDSL hydrolase family protein [Leptospira santarosai]MDI7222237.1 SGNH/GDSL hydrolase family protein [Leptospira santarosai]
MKKVCWILLIGIFSILPNDLFAQFEVPGPSLSDTGACSLDGKGILENPFGKKLTGWGHSRDAMAAAYIADSLIDPNDPSKGTILAPGQLDKEEISLNFIGGSTVTDNPGDQQFYNQLIWLVPVLYYRIITAFVPPIGIFAAIFSYSAVEKLGSQLTKGWANTVNKNWNHRIARCMGTPGQYRSAWRVYSSLGTADIAYYYEYMEVHEALYILFLAIVDPKKFIWDVIADGKTLSGYKELFWMWQFEAKEDSTVEGLRNMFHYILSFHAQVDLSNVNQLIFLTDGPFFTKGNNSYKFFNLWNPDDLRAWIRGNYFLQRLGWKAIARLSVYPPFIGRLHFVDLFSHFWGNIVNGGSSYYFPIPGDGIHYSIEGNKAFGRLVAAKMARIGWFAKNNAISTENLDNILNGGAVVNLCTPIPHSCNCRCEFLGFPVPCFPGQPPTCDTCYEWFCHF